ncbi:MAG: Aspartyl/glutamyl-tRNA(Asn/Gln) amidotransferase subunit C [Parcubacteria group bacterium GW2011_GWB1_41_6]|nr:MAG: Aspartyl/glutamyl-tRNA(Asn/Gln) amidotransferase subunit C [Parcubacteria group bacterium GW2011_GWB1_41_6]
MITKAEVEKLAHLARIELGEAEKKELQKELGSILDFVSKLKKTEVGEIQAGGRIFEETNVFREDGGVFG